MTNRPRPATLHAAAYEIFTAMTRSERDTAFKFAHAQGTDAQNAAMTSMYEGRLVNADGSISVLGDEVVSCIVTISEPPSDAPRF